MRRLAYILVVVTLMVGITGCGESATGIDTNVQITASFELDAEGVRLQGTTNIPDGAILAAEVYPEWKAELSAEENDRRKKLRMAQPLEVKNGEYSHYFNLKEKNWTPGLEASITVTFSPWGPTPIYPPPFRILSQPAFVYEAYGRYGKKMEGTGVHGPPGKSLPKMAGLNLDFTWNPVGTEAYLQKEQYDLAIADYTKAIEVDPNDSAAYNNRACAHHDKGQYDLAIADYAKAIELDPSSSQSFYNRALAYKQQDNKTKAIADFEKFITLTDDRWDIDMARQQIEELSE